MKTKLIPLDNSMDARLPKALEVAEGSIELPVEERDILISSAKKPRHDWEKRFVDAVKAGEIPEKDMFEGSPNDFDKTEWTW